MTSDPWLNPDGSLNRAALRHDLDQYVSGPTADTAQANRVAWYGALECYGRANATRMIREVTEMLPPETPDREKQAMLFVAYLPAVLGAMMVGSCGVADGPALQHLRSVVGPMAEELMVFYRDRWKQDNPQPWRATH